MTIDNSGECLPCPLPPGDFNQKIDILRENDIAQGRRSVEKIGIIYRIRAVLLGGQYGDAAVAQSLRHRAAYMCIHV